jgi:N-acetylneuraminic acid mutarotase
MKLKLILSVIALSFLTALISCDETDEPAKPPVITSFTPESALEGATVTIAGNNFSSAVTDVVVKFNGVTSAVTSATETEIVTTVPTGAATGKIEVIIKDKLSGTSANDFIVTYLPVITSFSPSSAYEGETVIVSGQNFSTSASENIVKFNGVTATVTAATATSITTTVPTGATTGKLQLTTNGNTATSVEDFGLLYPPSISSFAPTTGYARASTGYAGATVTITGNHFASSVSDNIVTINSITATVLTASTTQITVEVPLSATTGKVSVAVNGRESLSVSDFTVLPTNVWNEMPGPLPDALLRSSGIAFVIGTKIYFGLGQNASNVNMKDFWEYDTETNIFTQRKDFGGIARNGATGFSIGSKGYVATGFNLGSPLADLWEYDPATDNWTSKDPLPGPARSGAISLSLGGKGYVGTGIVGGASPTYFNDFYEYDPANNSWAPVANVGIGVAGRTSAARFVIENKAYVGGGSSNGARQDFWAYTPNAWQSVPDITTGPGVGTGFSFSIGTKGFVQASSQLWMFDPATGQWTRKADFPIVASTIGVSVGNVGYVITGSSANKIFYKYVPN